MERIERIEELTNLKYVCLGDEITALSHVLASIDEMLMTSEELVIQAAITNKLTGLDNLLQKHPCDLSDAIVGASSRGYLEMMIRLLCQMRDQRSNINSSGIGNSDSDSSDSDSSDSDSSVSDSSDSDSSDSDSDSDSIASDGSNNDIESSGIRDNNVNGTAGAEVTLNQGDGIALNDVTAQMRQTLRQSIVAAAENGHLAIVMFSLPKLVGLGRDNNVLLEMCETVWKIIDEAAANGHLGVVTFAVEFAFDWGFIESYQASTGLDALSRAIAGGHDDVARLLLQLTDPEWDMQSGLELALKGKRPKLIEWMYILVGDEDSLFTYLVMEGDVSGVKDRCCNQAVSPQLCNGVFEIADNVDVIRVLLETGYITTGSTTNAFRNAVIRCTSGDPNLSSEDFEIAKLLRQQDCVPARVIRTAFDTAAESGCLKLVEFLVDDYRVSSKLIREVFTRSALSGKTELVETIYTKHEIPPAIIFEALIQAIKKEYLELVEFFFFKTAIPESMKEKAFLKAVRFNKMSAVHLMCANRQLSREALRKATQFARDHLLKKFLREELAKETSTV